MEVKFDIKGLMPLLMFFHLLKIVPKTRKVILSTLLSGFSPER